MVNLGRRAVEDQVAGLQRRPLRNVRALVVLGVGRARQRDTGRGIGEGGQARAVEAVVAVGRPVAAPDIGEPDLGHRGPDRDLGALVGQRGRELRLTLLVGGLVGNGRRTRVHTEVDKHLRTQIRAGTGRRIRRPRGGMDHPAVHLHGREGSESAATEDDEEHGGRGATGPGSRAGRRTGRSKAEIGLRAVRSAHADPELRHVGIFEPNPLSVTQKRQFTGFER